MRSWRRNTRTVKASFNRRLCLKTSRANRRCRLRPTASTANATTTATRRGDRTCPRGLRCSGAPRSFAGSASTQCILPGLDRREAPDRTRGCGSAALLDRARVAWCPRCSKEEPCGLSSSPESLGDEGFAGALTSRARAQVSTSPRIYLRRGKRPAGDTPRERPPAMYLLTSGGCLRNPEAQPDALERGIRAARGLRGAGCREQ